MLVLIFQLIHFSLYSSPTKIDDEYDPIERSHRPIGTVATGLSERNDPGNGRRREPLFAEIRTYRSARCSRDGLIQCGTRLTARNDPGNGHRRDGCSNEWIASLDNSQYQLYWSNSME